MAAKYSFKELWKRVQKEKAPKRIVKFVDYLFSIDAFGKITDQRKRKESNE